MCNIKENTGPSGDLEEDSNDDSMSSDVSMTTDSESDQDLEYQNETTIEGEEEEETGDGVDEEDPLVIAIKKALEKPSEKPPEVYSEDYIVDISFHPCENVIAAATVTGDANIYKYSLESTELTQTLEVHTKACRAVEFSDNGDMLFTVSKDKSIMVTDFQTGKLKWFCEDAHEDPLYSLALLDENLVVTGDEAGRIKLWDIRKREPIFSLKEMEDYVSSIVSTEAKRYVVCTCGDGTITSFNLGTRKMHIQSEPYEAEYTCATLIRKNSKLVVGSSRGSLVFYGWGDFGLHTEEFPGVSKKCINCIIPVTENIVVTGWEDGQIRATYLFPHKNLGIVGHHSLSVESLDISHDGEFIASCSLDQILRFWPISYFEDISTYSVDKKEKNRNLPSSNYVDRKVFFADLA